MTRVWLGQFHGCATVKSGELECWGANDVGQLGDGTKNQSLFPVKVTVERGPFVHLALGSRHTCGVFAGLVRCWGGDARRQVTGASRTARATAIAAAGDRTCVLVGEEGEVRCWGGDLTDHAIPDGLVGTAVLLAVGVSNVCAAFTAPKREVRCTGLPPMLLNASIKGLAVGAKHACALLEDGTVQCWGANESGQLGDGSTTDGASPVLVHALPPAVEIHAAGSTTCARLASNTVACWGDNTFHQLANGTTTKSTRPHPVQGLMGVFELALGGHSACARLAEGGARCWGGNEAGQLGDGTTSEHDVPMPVRSPLAAK
jgi:alpha-tubulin suppressor-like RCC1 family protein